MIPALDENGEICALRHVARIIARRKPDPVKALQPLGVEITRDIIALQERQLRHARCRVGGIAPANRHVMPPGQMKVPFFM